MLDWMMPPGLVCRTGGSVMTIARCGINNTMFTCCFYSLPFNYNDLYILICHSHCKTKRKHSLTKISSKLDLSRKMIIYIRSMVQALNLKISLAHIPCNIGYQNCFSKKDS